MSLTHVAVYLEIPMSAKQSLDALRTSIRLLPMPALVPHPAILALRPGQPVLAVQILSGPKDH